MAEQCRRGIWAIAVLGSLAAAAAPIAMAQSTGAEASPALEEIVVSAQHRQESLQVVPISMSAISGDALENLGIKSFDQYASTLPNLSVGAGSGSGGSGSGFGVSTTKTYTIRGVFGDNTTGVYLNDSPVPPSMDPRLLDLDRIEVLRGPQGTLYGAGSMGGTIRFVSRTAATDSLHGKLEVEGFDVNAAGGGYSASGSINVPLVEGNLGLHASFLTGFDPGLYKRVWGGAQDPRSPTLPFPPGPVATGSKDHVGSEHASGVMLSLLATPTNIPGLTITPMFIYQRTRTNGYPLADYTPQDFVQTRPFDVPEAVGDTWDFESVTIKQETKFGNFVLLGNRFYRDGYDLEDTSDGNSIVFWGLPYYVPAPIIDHLYFRDYTGEARYESDLPGPVQFVAGIYWSQENRFYYQYFNAPGFDAATGGVYGTDLTFLQGSPNADHQRAAYADVTWKPLEQVRLSAGLRVAHVSHEGTYIASGPLNGGDSHNFAAHSENDRAPRYTAQYRYSPDQMLYAAAAKGFRIGGTNAYVPPQCDAALQELNIPNGHEFASDSLWSYELGLKNSWADGRVKSRIAAYEIDWKNTQRVVVLPCVWTIVANIGSSKSTGVEFELDAAPVQHLTANFTLGFENARVTQASQESHTVEGQPLQNVPRWTGSLTLQYSVPLDSERTGFVSAQYSYTGSRTSYNNTQDGLELASYGLADFRLGVDQGPWQLALSVRNAFNKLGVTSDLLPDGVQLPSRPRLFVTRPRTIGLQLRRNFK